jgi:hypothetical protein
MLRRFSVLLTVGLSIGLTAGCQIARDLLPRTHTTSTSPDGRYTAFVRQALNNDPPDDHLYLAPAGAAPRRLMDLAPDADWCRTIIWTSDSRRVGFLIRDQQLAVFDAATAEQVAMLVLVKADGYPGSQGARDVSFDGRAVSFERFERGSNRSLGREAASIAEERLALRVTWDGDGSAVKGAWVHVRLADGREVTIPTEPGTDGVVRLPAIDRGPFAYVEIVVPGVARTAILRDVRITPDPVAVRLVRHSG